MATGKDTLFERFLAPLFRGVLDQPELRSRYTQTNWAAVRDRIETPSFSYPTYYLNQAYHGIDQGYLSPQAAVTYDPITQWVMVPNEGLVRQALVDQVQGIPRRILDLGCGTGTMTVMLKQRFPQAEVTGIDLSPYMLFMAAEKAKHTHLCLTWHHGDAQQLPIATGTLDVVTAALLFHETPPSVTQQILQEAWRVLIPGGQLLILDANQETLQWLPWLQDLFEEPYIEAYAEAPLEAWITQAGFAAIRTENQWWANQLTWAIKPLPSHDVEPVATPEQTWGLSVA